MKTTLPASVLLAFAAAVIAQGATPPVRPADALAAAFHDALALAATRKAPILAFVLPPADAPADAARVAATRAAEVQVGMLVTKGGAGAPPIATARELMLRQLQLLRGAPASRGRAPSPTATVPQMLFALGVPVVATPKTCGAKPGETVVLLAPNGERVRGFALDLLAVEQFAAALGEELLTASALAARQANVPPALLADLARLRALREQAAQDAEAGRAWQALRARLEGQLVALAPALLHGADGELTADPELAEWQASHAPLGTEATMELGDPCPGCGMAYTPPGLMTVLKLIGP